MKSKVIALSAISASFIAVILTLGAYIELIDLVAIVLSSIFVMLPLYYKSYVGGWLSCIAGGLIAFMCSGFNIMSLVFPAYFVFFGVYPIVKAKLEDKKLNKNISLIIGLVWCVAAFYGVYFYYTLVMGRVFDGLPAWVSDYILIIVGAVSVLFYFVYDKFLSVTRLMIDRYVGKIFK